MSASRAGTGLDPRDRYIQEFHDKQALLSALGYLEGIASPPQELAGRIHGHELLVVEMFMEGLFHSYHLRSLCGVCRLATNPGRTRSV